MDIHAEPERALPAQPPLSEEAAARLILSTRWPRGFHCRCGSSRGWPLPRPLAAYECARCGRQTSLTAGTALQGTRVPLHKWIRMLDLLALPPERPARRRPEESARETLTRLHKDYIGARALSRHLALPYKTVWRMRQIFEALCLDDFCSPLRGPVAVDAMPAKVFRRLNYTEDVTLKASVFRDPNPVAHVVMAIQENPATGLWLWF